MDGAVISMGDTPFQYSEKEGMYTEVLDNLTGNVFLATGRDHEFLLSYRNTTLCTSTESRRSCHNYIKNSNSNTATCMWLLPSNPSDPLHPTYYERKREVWDEYISLIKQAIQNTGMAHEAFMCEANRDTRYIRTKYSVHTDPLYFEWDKFIPTLEKHFLDIWDAILTHDN